jgi:exodeoxyribonuclease V
MEAVELNSDQQAATTAILDWLKDPESGQFFILSGPAGTGKTFCIQRVVQEYKGRLLFTAPTNKATRVLRETLGKGGEYKPQCCTTFSALGLRLEPSGEVKVITNPDDPVDLSDYRCIVVDEGSMVSRPLLQALRDAVNSTGVKVLFMLDEYQLPPVGEERSLVLSLDARKAELTKVMRHDNQILTLATAIRGQIGQMQTSLRLVSDFTGDEGVWVMPVRGQFMHRIQEAALAGYFNADGQGRVRSKAIAWRNVTVDSLNRHIRNTLFPDGVAGENMWLPDDRVIFTAPARNLEDEPIASTDDEGTILHVAEGWHQFYPEYKVWNMMLDLVDGRRVNTWVLHPDSEKAVANKLAQIAAEAKVERRKWKFYWDLKDAFHSLRHAYAITAHRSQGSTYEDVFVDYRDILLNQTRREAWQCLYVAATRAKKRLVLA